MATSIERTPGRAKRAFDAMQALVSFPYITGTLHFREVVVPFWLWLVSYQRLWHTTQKGTALFDSQVEAESQVEAHQVKAARAGATFPFKTSFLERVRAWNEPTKSRITHPQHRKAARLVSTDNHRYFGRYDSFAWSVLAIRRWRDSRCQVKHATTCNNDCNLQQWLELLWKMFSSPVRVPWCLRICRSIGAFDAVPAGCVSYAPCRILSK